MILDENEFKKLEYVSKEYKYESVYGLKTITLAKMSYFHENQDLIFIKWCSKFIGFINHTTKQLIICKKYSFMEDVEKLIKKKWLKNYQTLFI